MAKRNCRRTDEERAVHDRAVSLRKMNDQALCDFMDAQHKNGIDLGIQLAKGAAQEEAAAKPDAKAILERFIDYLQEKVGSGNGIGGGTVMKLRKEVEQAVADSVFGGV